MERKRKIVLSVLCAITALTLLFIWGNSLKPQKASLESSGGVFEFLKPTLDKIFGRGKITHEIIRQAAHFAEFFLLGIEASLIYFFAFNLKKERLSDLVSIGLFVAVIDESLQMITDRGPEIVDVLCDYGGYISAVIIFIGVVSLI